MRARFTLWLVLLPAIQLACATSGTTSGPEVVSAGIAERARVDAAGWPQRAPGAVPPDVTLNDLFTIQEAVATALWNNPSFQLTLTDLGVARAELVDAGLLRNPVLSMLFPWGPKQLEFTVNWAIDSIWQRPRRLAAAKLDVEAIASRLVQDGLVLMANVRTAYIQAAAASRRAEVARDVAEAVARFADIIDARLEAGEISDLEARATRGERAIAEAAARTAEHDRTLALVRLKASVGLAQDTPLTLTPITSVAIADCADANALLKEALAARPDVRAAELAVEAAGERAGLARAQVLALTAMLDANGSGREGFELGPGLQAELPIFSQNSGGRARASAALVQAELRYLLVRARVDEDVHAALAMLERARAVVSLWEDDALGAVSLEQRQAELAYKAGEVQLLTVLEANRRFGTIRLGALDARRDLLIAAAALDQAIGRSCAFK